MKKSKINFKSEGNKVETVDFREFMRQQSTQHCIVIDIPDLKKKSYHHIRKNGHLYCIAGLSLVLVSIPDTAFASTGIDKGGMKIYKKLVNVGKWIIIVKGGIDIITSITNGDIDSAKKRFIGYLLAYGTLWALPWGMDQVEQLFQDETTFQTE
jgi:hypothetical protein